MRMKQASGFRGHLVSAVAILLVVCAYLLARDPVIGANERNALSQHFHFELHPLDVEPFAPRGLMTVREVHPSLERIQSWISATGAACTISDLDRDGYYNDMLLIDPRLNTVLIQPVPKTGNRFAPFVLDPVGLDYEPPKMSPTGCLVSDFDEDGLDDILVYYWGRTPVVFFQQRHSDLRHVSAIDFVAKELIPPTSANPLRWFTHAGTLADIDGDGHLDLLLGNFFQDDADILNAHGTGVVSVMHEGKSNARNGGGAKLFLWTRPQDRSAPDEIFRNASAAIEKHCGKGWVLAIGAVDLDPGSAKWPGLPEIYIANDFGPDRLLHNRSTPGVPDFRSSEGTRGFTTPKSFVLGHDSNKGMGLDFGDINRDGLFDMYISNISEDFALHEGHFVFVSTGKTEDFQAGIAPYHQVSSSLGLNRGGWGWDCRFVDFDNDGILEAVQATGMIKGTINRWPELHALGTTNDQLISNPKYWPRFRPPTADLSGHDVNPFYVRSSSGRYVDVAAELGLDEPWNTRGLAVADVDGDGWQDFVAANQWESSVFFHNRSGNTSHQNSFVAIHLILPPVASPLRKVVCREGHPNADSPGRPAIGAIVSLEMPDGRRLVSQVDGGSGHSGKRAPTVHFGLGPNPPDDLTLDLTWRDRDGHMQHAAVTVRPSKWYTVELGQRNSQ